MKPLGYFERDRKRPNVAPNLPALAAVIAETEDDGRLIVRFLPLCHAYSSNTPKGKPPS